MINETEDIAEVYMNLWEQFLKLRANNIYDSQFNYN